MIPLAAVNTNVIIAANENHSAENVGLKYFKVMFKLETVSITERLQNRQHAQNP